MKTFMRSILIGVCILLGYGLVEASDRVVIDTIDKCLETGSRIYKDVVDAEFREFQKKDRQWVGAQIDISGGSIDYDILDHVFSGEGLDAKDSPTAMMGIGNVTMDLRNQYIQCTIIYTRKIRFKKVNMDDYYDSENALQEKDLLGDTTGNYPEFILKSKREWHAVIRIKKKVDFPKGRFFIERNDNDTCLDDKVTLWVPEQYADMRCVWSCDNTYVDMSNEVAPKITISRKNLPFLTTNVQCTIHSCDDNSEMSSSIRIRSRQTPASELTFSNCLPTDATYIDVVATNPLSGVKFLWGNDKLDATPSSNAQTVRYPVPDIHNFSINLTTTGGCEPHRTTKVVQRKLSNNVKLRIVDNDCLIAQHPFRVVTEPALIGWSLIWTRHPDYTIALINSNRADMVAITKNKAETGFQQIEVRDRACGGSISVIPYITALKMVVKDEDGNTLQSGATVKAGSTITFTAPKHSSITGDKPYTWSISTRQGELANITNGKGEAERTLTAPSAGTVLSVTVSYVSCRGEESESYTIYSR